MCSGVNFLCVVLGYASIISPVFLCLHVYSLLSVGFLAVSVCVCCHSLSVSACVRVCVHSVKWNGRRCREYNRGPTEVASRHSSSLPLTL